MNRLWLEPGSAPAVSEATLVVKPARLDVSWAHESKPHRGSVVLRGPPASCAAEFQDTFHASSEMTLHGRVDGFSLALYGTYGAGPGQPEWGWRLTLDWADPDGLLLRMFNVTAEGEEMLAVDLAVRR